MQADTPLAVGWTAWVTDSDLCAGMQGKARPFCRGRSSKSGVPWFPRTGKEPDEGTRWAVYSPAGQLPCLKKEGWFVASRYVIRDDLYRPITSEECGTLDGLFVEELHDKLEAFFWDPDRFRSRGRSW
jgi:hypothetical protein